MSPKGYHHMTRDQRCHLQRLKSRALSQRKIAEEIEKKVEQLTAEGI